MRLPYNYFDLFDKTIITSDDLSLKEKCRKTDLENRGYSFVTARYGTNIDVVKQIIKRRIRLYNEIVDNSDRKFDEKNMIDTIYHHLVNKTNGNISLMLNILGEIVDLLDWRNEHIDIENAFDIETSKQLKELKKSKKMDVNPPRFHL